MGKPSAHPTRGQSLNGCHLLFISSSEKKRLAQILDSLRGTSVVTVSDLHDFYQQGGVIGLILEGNKVRFIIKLRKD